MSDLKQNVAVLGASNNPERYSYQAVKLLAEKGHQVYPVHPRLTEIEGVKVYPSLGPIDAQLDTISIYVNPEISSQMIDEILAAKPRRVITNPGTENPLLKSKLEDAGVEVLEACTLVMLRTGQF